MSWKMKNKPQVTKASPQLIERFATMEPAPGDRPLGAKRAARTRHLLLTGQFRTCEWAAAHCAEDGVTYRVNGKHTSTMLSQMNGEAPRDLFVIVEEYDCDTLDDVARLYATFDSRDSTRTTADINRSFSGAHDDLRALPLKIINVAVSGIAYEEYEDKYTTIRAEDRAAKMLDHGGFVIWMNELMHGGEDSKHLKRIPPVAAMFRTYRKHQQDSEKFWSLVRDGSGPSHHSPDRKLHKYLLTTTVGTGRGATTGKSLAGNRELYIKCLHAWNAWRKGEETNLKYFPAAETPKAF